MRQAMASADVGDDVFGEDPTVNRLQEEVASILGKEAALFVPSGMMANQIAIKVHTEPGDEVLLERDCHILNYESGAPAVLSGVQLSILQGNLGVLEASAVTRAVRAGHYWEARSRLLCLENTINKSGGRVYPLDRIAELTGAARGAGLSLHLDGARLWNASVASGISERQYAAPFDTVSVCLSKGLGAPIGSLIAGSRNHMVAARRFRKMFGGGMRQVGILAAAGLHALVHHRDRLEEDHRNARRLAEGLADAPGVEIDVEGVQSNIVLFGVPGRDVGELVDRLSAAGVLVLPFGPTTIRAITHLDVSSADVDRAVREIQRLVRPGSA